MGVPVYDSDSRTKALYDEDTQLRGALVDLLGKEILTGGNEVGVAAGSEAGIAADADTAGTEAGIAADAVAAGTGAVAGIGAGTARINRRAMAAKIFGNPSLMKKLKELVYPAVIKDFTKWKSQFEDATRNSANLATCIQSDSSSHNLATRIQSDNNVASTPPFVIFESAIILENPDVLAVAEKVLTVSSPLEVRVERIRLRDGGTDLEIQARINNQWTDEQREAMADFVIVSDNKAALLPQVENVYNKVVG
jgi:dephospho-CoA kinase